jgi:transcription initiation factor TFIIE subunit alpha
MIKEGMNLTEEQRGEMRQEAKVDGGAGAAAKLSDDKKSAIGNGDEKDLKDEYLKAYYAELMKQQELAARRNQQESAGEPTSGIQSGTVYSGRQVSMKAKREEDEDEDEEEVEWEEKAPVTANGNYKVDLNVEAEASGGEEEEEEDDVDWEEG